MGFVSNPLNFRGLGYQGKHQIYFLFGPFDFGHLPTKKNVSHLPTPADLVLEYLPETRVPPNLMVALSIMFPI